METNQTLIFASRLDQFYISSEKSELIEFIGTTQINRLQKTDVYAFLGEEAGKQCLAVVDLFSRAVYKARTDSRSASLPYFRMANKELEILQADAYLFTRLFYASGWSFFFYLKGVYGKASAFTIEGLALSEHLEAKGAAFLGSRRLLDQLPNLGKILIHQGNAQDGYSLYNGILRALIYKDFTHLPGKWNKHMFDRDEYTRQQGIDNVVISATRLILANTSDDQENLFYQILFRGIGYIDVSNDHLEVIERFITLKRSYFEHRNEAFLSQLEEFLTLSMDTYFDILKLSVIRNYLVLSKIGTICEADQMEIKTNVTRYLNRHLHLLPAEQHLLPLLCKEFKLTNLSQSKAW
jgi:hypothetical protein